MGNYRQHIGFAWALGLAYGAVAYFLAGLHWLYGSVAVLLATLAGLLPDLDSASGIELRSFTGILGVLGALVVWMEVGQVDPPPVFELRLWAMVGTFLMIRHGLKRTMLHLTSHRGISHSIPTCAVWAELTYLHYPTESHQVKLMMGAAVAVGFLSHLFLDEVCSVDLKGVRLNKAFGTAMKFWAPSIWSTLAIYALLSLLTWQIVRDWPEIPFGPSDAIRAPQWPESWPKLRLPDSWLRSLGETERKAGFATGKDGEVTPGYWPKLQTPGRRGGPPEPLPTAPPKAPDSRKGGRHRPRDSV